MSTPSIPQAALVLALGNVGSRVLGLAREQVIAGLFGATAATDAFRVSSRVPLALYDLLVGGMVSSALVPVFSEHLADERQKDLGNVVNTLINLVLFVLTGAVLLLGLAAPLLVRLLATGYPEEVRLLAVDLVRLLLPSLVFLGLSGVLTAVLYARQHFALPSLAVMAYNGGIVVVALLLHAHFGITSLALGVLTGAGLQVALQLPGFRGLGYRLRLDVGHPGVRQVARLYLPVALGLVVSTLGIAIDTNLASRTGEGNLAALGFATTLVQFPLGLVATAVSSAMLPTLSRFAQGLGRPTVAGSLSEPRSQEGPPLPPETYQEDPTQPGTPPPALVAYKSALALGLRLVLITILPATLGLVLLRRPVIRLLFQRGAFDALAAQRTSAAFFAYSPGLPAAAMDQVLIFGYYARQRTLTPVLVGIMAVGVYLAVGIALLEPLGMPGLALANSAQWVSHMLVMAALTYRSLGGLQGLGLFATACRAVVASAVMGGLLSLVVALAPIEGMADPAVLGGILAVLLIAGAAAYFATLALIGRDELRLLSEAMRTRGRAGR